MKALSGKVRGDVALIILYFGMALPLQVWAVLEGPLPGLNYGHGWTSSLAYGFGAPMVTYLLWRRNPRARLATYILLFVDVIRSVGLGHWLLSAIDVALILYLQTPAMRHLYPSLWSRKDAIRSRISRLREL